MSEHVSRRTESQALRPFDHPGGFVVRSVRVTLPQALRRQRPWGFSDPSVVMVDITGHVSLESPVGSPYGVGDELSDGRFDCGMFSKMGSLHERVAYLHGCGYSAVPAGDGFAVRFEDGINAAAMDTVGDQIIEDGNVFDEYADDVRRILAAHPVEIG